MRGVGWQRAGAIANLGAYYGVGLPTALISVFLFRSDSKVISRTPNLCHETQWIVAHLVSSFNPMLYQRRLACGVCQTPSSPLALSCTQVTRLAARCETDQNALDVHF